MRSNLPWTLLVLLSTAASLHAAGIEVSPGPGTPFQDAIDAAPPGATIHVQPGTYPEALVVTKALKIRALGEVRVDAGCLAATALEIAADRVTIKGVRGRPFVFQRGQTTGILIANRADIKLDSVGYGSGFDVQSANCSTAVGIDVQGGTKLKLSRLQVGGLVEVDLTQIGIRVRDVAAGSKIRLLSPDVVQGNPALVLHNVAPGALRGRSGVRIIKAVIDPSPGPAPGMMLGSADGVFVKGSSLFLAPGGTTSLALDAASDNNVIKSNHIEGDALDAGAGNCWIGNRQFGSGTIPASCGPPA